MSVKHKLLAEFDACPGHITFTYQFIPSIFHFCAYADRTAEPQQMTRPHDFHMVFERKSFISFTF